MNQDDEKMEEALATVPPETNEDEDASRPPSPSLLETRETTNDEAQQQTDENLNNGGDDKIVVPQEAIESQPILMTATLEVEQTLVTTTEEATIPPEQPEEDVAMTEQIQQEQEHTIHPVESETDTVMHEQSNEEEKTTNRSISPILVQPIERGEYFPLDIKESLHVVLQKLKKTNIRKLVTVNKINKPFNKKATIEPLRSEVGSPSQESATLNKITERCVDIGVDHFVTQLDRSDMRQAILELARKFDLTSGESISAEQSLSITEESLSSLTKPQLREKFSNALCLLGVEQVLKSLSTQLLHGFVEVLLFSHTEEEGVEDAILEEIFLHGAKTIFKSIPKRSLRDFLLDLNKKLVSNNATKYDIIRLILCGEFTILSSNELLRLVRETEHKDQDEDDSSPTKPVTRSARKGKQHAKIDKTDRPSIEKGITAEELTNKYYANELYEFCRQNDIKNKGTKASMITQILQFLDGGNIVQVQESSDEESSESSDEEISTRTRAHSSRKPSTPKKRKYTTKKRKRNTRASKKRKVDEESDSEVIEHPKPAIVFHPKGGSALSTSTTSNQRPPTKYRDFDSDDDEVGFVVIEEDSE